ncbi:DUF29 domain-containing protein [Acaryochloris marina]|uniref:DUF29 domain-containing protein n=1 Tax=Acaryochloris marina (strain MBIC 11017) TaxID=329726 RepID=A8ZQN3_ACAM1|nr:DUF29 domain-containing protein [Acaryochloris marina]ABW33319.1 conserved hypothetical protein [Acaryochloris marina MBIC11017]
MTTNTRTLYDRDVVEWADRQAQLLRDGRFDLLDLENLIEEVEDVGNRHRDKVKSQLKRMLWHLLKIKYQPSKHTDSWDITIVDAANQIKDEFEDRPSLRRHLEESFDLCYKRARRDAANETRLDISTFPMQCPESIRVKAWELINSDD